MRTETDIIGSVTLDDDCLYGINTARALDNFAMDSHRTDLSLISAIVTVKKAAAVTYRKLGIKPEMYAAAAEACDEVIEALETPGDSRIKQAFPLDALQGGAGTSTNMNVNEVIANLTLIKLGHKPGEYEYCHPLNDINMGQSTNDVYPTGLRIAAIRGLRKLSSAAAALQESLQKKELEFERIKKLGRTELMDAVPVTLGGEFGAYAQAIARDRWRIYKVEERLRQVNLGGAAVGGEDLSLRGYRFGVIEELRKLTDIGIAKAEYPMDITQNQDVFVEVSGLLKSMAVNMMKIAGDLRLMASGPYGGLGEIRLKPVQQGSTVMPGKINPVIPEMVLEAGTKVISCDAAVTYSATRGEFELNALVPLIADSLLTSIRILKNAADIFREKCIDVLEADEKRCREILDSTYAFAASYLADLGYDTVSRTVKENAPAGAKKILEEMKKEKEGR
ncbi:MAG: lyase family protein [Anaerovoracaceae bacterium]|nr:lyase family protein [Bacillota bacterium]MDY2671261.1 lyase family protein [Anaerovoracaceae bacterium]